MKVLQVVTAIGGAALVVLGASMALTNPGQDTYEQYAVEQLATYLKNEGCSQAPPVFGNVLQNQCKSLVDTGRPQLQQIISETTQRQNFILFSVYRTNLEVGSFLPVYHFETVGIFQNFYIYQASEQ